jgi:hypothetical protein
VKKISNKVREKEIKNQGVEGRIKNERENRERNKLR